MHFWWVVDMISCMMNQYKTDNDIKTIDSYHLSYITSYSIVHHIFLVLKYDGLYFATLFCFIWDQTVQYLRHNLMWCELNCTMVWLHIIWYDIIQNYIIRYDMIYPLLWYRCLSCIGSSYNWSYQLLTRNAFHYIIF